MASTPLRLVAACCAALPLSSCCTMARLFCGPDKSDWVPIAFDSPRATLTTFLEAVRRDDPGVVYSCLAGSFRRAHDFDAAMLTAGWERLRQEVTGLHLLGYATVPAQPTVQQDRGVSYELEVEGHRLRIDLVRESYWEVRYRDPAGEVRETSRGLDDTLNGLVQVMADGEDPAEGTPRSRLLAAVRGVEHPYIDRLRLEDVDLLAIGREWKISDLVPLDDR
ncbi:MAG: hypothetical protein AB7O97_17985 [Planctomycetota bacterium]